MSITISEIVNTVTMSGDAVTNITVSDSFLGSATGDLSGNYPSPTVTKIGGVAVNTYLNSTYDRSAVLSLFTECKNAGDFIESTVSGGVIQYSGGYTAYNAYNCSLQAQGNTINSAAMLKDFSTANISFNFCNIRFDTASVFQSSSADHRVAIGFFTATTLGSDRVAFVNTGEINWQASVQEGAVDSSTDTGVPVASRALLSIRYDVATSEVKFYANETLVATKVIIDAATLASCSCGAYIRTITGTYVGNPFITVEFLHFRYFLNRLD